MPHKLLVIGKNADILLISQNLEVVLYLECFVLASAVLRKKIVRMRKGTLRWIRLTSSSSKILTRLNSGHVIANATYTHLKALEF